MIVACTSTHMNLLLTRVYEYVVVHECIVVHEVVMRECVVV